jgi:hypothetical protein
MNKILALLFLYVSGTTFSQEKLIPLSVNPYLQSNTLSVRSGNSIDSSFQGYVYANIDLPVRDDFSTNKFVDYNIEFTDPGVTSAQYFQLMDASNVTPLNINTILCDSSHSHHDTIVVVGGVSETNSTYSNTGIDVFVNDLNSYPILGINRTLFNECYILIDSVIDFIPNPTQDTVWYNSAPDFTQDSARVFFANMTNANNIWIDDYACHNYRYAKDPWSLGVVTFDGVSNDGYPYQWGSLNAYGDADVLTSKPINLAGKTNVFLTFQYQAKGYGNSPETFDSLILELYDPIGDVWYNSDQWGADGDVQDDVWYTAHVLINQGVLLVDGFQFRIRNKATLSGVLDHWHIDYVNLRDNSTLADTIIDDIAIMEPVESFLIDYTAVPWDHYSNLPNPNTVMQASKDLKVRNNHTSAKLQNSGGLIVDGSSFSLPVLTPNWEVGVNIYNFGVATLPYVFPQVVAGDTMASFDVKVNVATSSTNIYDINDTTYFTQEFKNFYAYDDGTAETAYGFEVFNAELAYKFEAYEADELAGVLMKFIPSNENISNNIFLLTLWADDNGQPGEIIYQDDYFSPHYPNYAGNKGEYQYYKFNNDQFIPVPKIFYVGWEQIDNDMLYIGMDLNNDNSDKIFYNTGGAWTNTVYQGSLIIRPVFSTGLDGTLKVEDVFDENQLITIYPNPTNNIVNLSGLNSTDKVEIKDLSGRIIYLSDAETSISLNDFSNGIYVVCVYNEVNKLVYSDKLIKY